MRGFILTERKSTTSESVLEFSHYKVPQGMAWRLDLITGINYNGADGTMYLIVKSGGTLSYLAPSITLSSSRATQYTYPTVLYESDEIYVYVTGLAAAADIEFSVRGLEVEQDKVFYRM
jgi:hypothetical protein